MDLYDNLTTVSRDALDRADAIAVRMQHEQTGSEHLLLGLMATDNPASKVLQQFGVTTERVEPIVTVLRKPYMNVSSQAVRLLTPHLKMVLHDAVELGKGEQTHTRLARPEHLLVALLRGQSANVKNVFAALGVNYVAVLRDISPEAVSAKN